MTKQEIFFDDIERMDAQDPLANKQKEFYLPDNKVYLDGNSLGPLPLVAKRRAKEVVDQQWGDDLITSWNRHQWIELPTSVGKKIASLIGANVKPESANQVICCDSVSVNIFKLLATALSINSDRHKILSQSDNFPTDLYMAQGLSQLLGNQRCELVAVDEASIESSIDDSIAVLLLTQINFRTGKVHDIKRITELAHQHGVLVIWDLAHSAGVIPIELDNWNVDFAVGCGYKYFNGGPGAPAFVYAAERHHANMQQPLSGWMGHQSPFEFNANYQSDAGIKQFLCGTPAVVSMSLLDAALDVFNDVTINQIREKSLALSDLFIRLVKQHTCLKSLQLITPLERNNRGSQLAFTHDQAYAICQALIAEGIIADFRAPNILRVGFSPLFLSFKDIYRSVETLNRIISEKIYENEAFQVRQAVT